MASRALADIAGTLMLIALCLTGCAAQPSAEPGATPTTTGSPSDPPTPSPTPTLTPTPTADAVDPTCENTSTDAYHAMMERNEWVSWELPYNGIGGDGNFASFPQGEPPGALDCRWGNDPDLATDNVIDLAWAPIEADAAAAAQAQLEAAGFERIEAPEGVYLAMKGADGWADEEGYAQTYLFTDDDVRWAMFKDEVAFIKAPDEAG